MRSGPVLRTTILALAVAGCSQAVASPGTTPPAATTPETSAGTAEPSVPSSSATPGMPTTVTSESYRYRLTFPPGVATTAWDPASRPWNGTEPISSDVPYNDSIGTIDGGVFVFGTSWNRGLSAFTTTVLAKVAQEHGCLTPESETATTVGGEAATLVRQECAGPTALARIFVVHAGRALVISEMIDPGREAGAATDLATWFAALVWSA